MRTPTAAIKQSQINEAIADVVNLMAPRVVHIRYDIGEDWSGDWAIFFRVLLSDDASDGANLHDVAREVDRTMSDKIDFPAMGVFAYFNFRSESEQAVMQEPAWA